MIGCKPAEVSNLSTDGRGVMAIRLPEPDDFHVSLVGGSSARQRLNPNPPKDGLWDSP